MKIEVFKAAKQDKKATIRTRDLQPFVDLDKYKKGTKVFIEMKDGSRKWGQTFHLSRPQSKLNTHCSTLYGDGYWDTSLPKIQVGKKTLVDVVKIVVMEPNGQIISDYGMGY